MRFRMISALAVTLTLALVGAATARAGIYIETAERERGKVVGTQKTWVQGGKMRVDNGKTISLWKDDSFTILDPRKQTYTVMDRAALQSMGAQMAGMQSQLAGMPPEQRAMVERMMGGGAMGRPAATVEVIDTGVSETLDGRSCRLWDVKRNGALKQKSCVVAYATLPGQEDLQALFEGLASFMDELRSALPDMEAQLDTAHTDQMNGYPVITRDYANGEPNGKERRLVTWREEAAPAALFEVPAGYEQRQLAESR